MNDAAAERLKKAVEQIREAGIFDAIVVAEMDETPVIVRVGSQMAAISLADYASEYLNRLRNKHLDIVTEDYNDGDDWREDRNSNCRAKRARLEGNH